MQHRRAPAAWGFGAALLLVATGAGAGGASATDLARAKDAYERGSIAYRHGDYARAAAEFAQADQLAPDPVALRAALDAATLADDPVLGTELLERSARAPSDRSLAEVVAKARARFAHRTGKVVVTCPPGCLATLDGAPLDPAKPRVVAVGVHTLTIQTDGPAEQRIVQVAADQTFELSPSAPSSSPSASSPSPSPPSSPSPSNPEPEPTSEPEGGVSPAWFLAAAGATAIVGGLTIWSALDTRNRHSTFENECGPAPSAPASPGTCSDLQGNGLSAEHRTNALLVATGALALGTAALGLFFVRWNTTVEVRGAGLSLRTSF
jgi:hypothetical protein